MSEPAVMDDDRDAAPGLPDKAAAQPRRAAVGSPFVYEP